MTCELEFSKAEKLSTLGRNLKFFMRCKGVNNIELHEKLGISTGTVSKIINANCTPNVLTLYKITSYLDIKIDDLFTEEYYRTNEVMLRKGA